MKPATADKEVRISGLPLSEGVAFAHVHALKRESHPAIPYYRIPESAVAAEKARLKRALDRTAEEIQNLVIAVTKRIGPAQANIFVAQKMIVQDEVLIGEMFQLIEEKRLNGEAALERTLDAYESLLLEVDNAYLKERASDIGEVGRRILAHLRRDMAEPPAATPSEPPDSEDMIILVADELAPGETASLDTRRVAGFVTERGGSASHAAILARALGIPAVSGIKDIYDRLPEGEGILINGATGEVILRPTPDTLRLYPTAKRMLARRLRSVEPVEGFRVMANIGQVSQIEDALAMQAEGIGLYRTEFEFLAEGRLLSEDEQYERYARAVKILGERPLYVRLLDFGGDKLARFLNIPEQQNPCLGYRGGRMLLDRPELLITQARALARASAHGPIHILYPMVVGLDQFIKLREIVYQNTRELPSRALMHGVMLEVPAACLDARRILDAADFASIGSNDLVQYLFAIDRNNSLVAADYRPDHPVFWALLGQIVQAAKDAGKPLSLCGEMGGRPEMLPRLLALGLRSVSVSPRLIPVARMSARKALRAIAKAGLPPASAL